ncbi:glycerol-3-phosphate phosphatase-like [Toxorhynchites rutilus septentrionalis]|uniref:glycerol-3-phosphate phosphatase-like n=1 Tax=Toxorhynchites rutilus septentrionalis TaxID=329112 RepID=UPI00247AD81A|nr:glycerol-3-phosphate phosphatase-like [Toxorhynchites rutilus septentrionalis]
MNKFIGNNKKLFFVTNNSNKSRNEFVAKSNKIGFNFGLDNIILIAYLVVQYLKAINFEKKCYVVGTTGIIRELDAASLCIVNIMTTCAEREPLVMGKPNKHFCDILEKEYKVDPERTFMIGDPCNTDILLGKNCAFQTLLVETGIQNATDI